MSDRLTQVYERLKLVTEHRTDEDGDGYLLYTDVISALRSESIPDSEVIGAVKDCLIAHAFIGASILMKVGGPQRMEIPVEETKSLAEALYYIMKIQQSMLDQEVMDVLATEEFSNSESENAKT